MRPDFTKVELKQRKDSGLSFSQWEKQEGIEKAG